MRPSTITLERKLAALYKAWFKVEEAFDALRLHNSTVEQNTKDNDEYQADMATHDDAKDKDKPPAGQTLKEEVTLLEVDGER